MLKALLPFAGFYESIHSAQIDYTIDQDCEHYGVEYDEYEKHGLNYQSCMLAYAEAYVNDIADKLEVQMKLEGVYSPSEYNFETDKILVEIDLKEVEKLFKRVPIIDLAKTIKERFTPRSGFVPFYSADINDWKYKPLNEWDEVELGTLLRAAMDDDMEEPLERVNEIIEPHLSYCEDWFFDPDAEV